MDAVKWIFGILYLEIDKDDRIGEDHNHEEDRKGQHVLDGLESHAHDDAHAFVVAKVVKHHPENTGSDHYVVQAEEVRPVDRLKLTMSCPVTEVLEVLGYKGQD